LSTDTTVLLFRLGVVVVLYLFLWEVVRAVGRELASNALRAPGIGAAANLEIISAGRARLRAGEVIVLDRATTIGREADNDVVVDEETVSSQHARIVARQGRWWIEDLHSTNGTWVNDANVVGSQALGKGDVIRVGRVRLRFSS
jgi:pSer/pThr/pTyr-binding forkhead associated (FHA) protein